MNPTELRIAILKHSGTFRCSRIHSPQESKVVSFKHIVTPADSATVPNAGDLPAFYSVFGSILFYVDTNSGDAARYIAPVDAWPELHDSFSDWMSHLDDAEREEHVPKWVDTCLVIGEEPHSGNYILVPTAGPEAGTVYHFDHDGFEFDRHADNLLQYAAQMLDLDNQALAYIAGHMRFVDGDPMVQWWIEELTDNRGNLARTRV